MEADIEKTADDTSERSLMLVMALLIVSVAVHIGLMLSVSDYSFTPLAASEVASSTSSSIGTERCAPRMKGMAQ